MGIFDWLHKKKEKEFDWELEESLLRKELDKHPEMTENEKGAHIAVLQYCRDNKLNSGADIINRMPRKIYRRK